MGELEGSLVYLFAQSVNPVTSRHPFKNVLPAKFINQTESNVRTMHLANKISLSAKGDLKLIRAMEVTASLYKHIYKHHLEHEPMPWLGEVLGYVSEDIACVVDEMNEQQ